MTSAWNSVVVGSKAWLMLPPHITPPGVYVSADEAEVTAPLSIAEWLLSFYKITKAKHGPRNKGGDGTLREGVCNAGETIYVPSGWWHLVVNLEGEWIYLTTPLPASCSSAIPQFLSPPLPPRLSAYPHIPQTESVALTQNFVSPAELPAVLHFMRHKPDQISGFKHRRGRNAPASAGPSSCAAPGRPRVAPPSDCHSQLDAGEEAGEEEGEECDEDEDDLKASSALYDLFCSRLQSHDPVLLDNALKVMRERESKENVHAGAQQSASAIRVETEKPAVGTGLSWWERLKQGGPRAGSTTDENHQGANDTLESSPKRETRAQTQTGTGTGTQTQTEAEAAKTQGGFALGLELPPEEELEDVPW